MFEEATQGSILDAEYWNCGYCSNFAARFRQRFGGELWVIANHSRKWNDDQLWHAYCVLDGVAYDASGAHTIAEASDTSKFDVPEMDLKHDVVFLWKQVDEAWFEDVHIDYSPEHFPDVDKYIDHHRHLFPRQ